MNKLIEFNVEARRVLAPSPEYAGVAMNYQNFDLEIIFPQEGGRLCARVLASPQGDCPFIDVT